jgi:hypothetical protein
MARNEVRALTDEMTGTMGSAAIVVAANPLGGVLLLGILSVLAALAVLSVSLWETRASWGTPALWIGLFSIFLIGHFSLRARMKPRAQRIITGSVLALFLVVSELSTGTMGVLVGRMTGWNPEGWLAAKGFPVTDGIAAAVSDQHADFRHENTCRKGLEEGAMLRGTSRSVEFATDCSAYVPLKTRIQSCQALAANTKSGVTDLSASFCRRIGIQLQARIGPDLT